MSAPDILVAVPVYRGRDVIGETLRSIRDQTYPHYQVLISLDGEDAESLANCEAFAAADSRLTLIVQPERLGWLRHFNWLLEACRLPYFCYWQQDDLAASNYLETLRTELLCDAEVAIAYSDVQWLGTKFHRDHTPSTVGTAPERVLAFIESIRYEPLRGLMRASALPRPNALDPDSDEGCHAEFPFLAAMASEGNLRHCPGTLYFKRSHAANTFAGWNAWPAARRRRAWIDMGLGFLSVAQRVLPNLQQRARLIGTIIDRLAVVRPGRGFFFQPPDETARTLEAFVRDFLERGDIDVSTCETTCDADPALTAFCRPIHPDIQRSLSRAAVAATQRRQLVDQLLRDERLIIDQHSDELPLFLGSGWSAIEEWGVWSDGDEATLLLPLPPDGRWSIQLFGRHFDGLRPDSAQVRWMLPNGASETVTLPTGLEAHIEIITESTAKVKLAFPDAVNLPDVGIPDARRIAFGLSRIMIQRV